MCDRLILRSIQMIDAGVADAIARGFVVHIIVDARLVLQGIRRKTVSVSGRFRVDCPPTAMLPLLRLFGRGTWKLRPKRSARSSSSLELEFSSVRMPFARGPRPSLLSATWRELEKGMREQATDALAYLGNGTGGAMLALGCICMVLCSDMPPMVPIPMAPRFG